MAITKKVNKITIFIPILLGISLVAIYANDSRNVVALGLLGNV
jgi:hypothetical protein